MREIIIGKFPKLEVTDRDTEPPFSKRRKLTEQIFNTQHEFLPWEAAACKVET